MPEKPDDLKEAVGRRLQALRLAQGFKTIRGFVNEMGFDEKRYDKWEKGKALIPPLFAEALVDRYGITLDWLYIGRKTNLPRPLYNKLPAA